MKNLDTPIYLELYLEEGEELNVDLPQLLTDAGVVDLLKQELYERIGEAIKQDKKEIPLFRLVYYGVDLKLGKAQYKKLLNKLLNIYQSEEDYLRCVEIKNLIERL